MPHADTRAVRPPQVAGMFYPGRGEALARAVDGYLAEWQPGLAVPKAVIAPHAGYVYSGPVAAAAYARIAAARGRIERVVLLGPSHRIPFVGIAAPEATAFATPLGTISVDREAVDGILDMPGVVTLDAAFDGEHCLEVHLPFLQRTLGSFALVPLIVGDAPPGEVAAVLETLWGGEATLIVISSDLSHYHDYEAARMLDRETAGRIERLEVATLSPDTACGCRAVAGLLTVAATREMRVTRLDLRNSGDTAGDRDRVVGYGAWAFETVVGTA